MESLKPDAGLYAVVYYYDVTFKLSYQEIIVGVFVNVFVNVYLGIILIIM